MLANPLIIADESERAEAQSAIDTAKIEVTDLFALRNFV